MDESTRILLYWLIIAAAALAGFAWTFCRRRELSCRAVLLFASLSVPLSLLLSRILYCAVCYEWLRLQGTGFIWRLAPGGLLLYGIAAGCLLSAWITGRVCRVYPLDLTDAAAPAFALLIAVKRFAEYLVGSGTGRSIEEWFDPMMEQSFLQIEDPSFLQRFPFAVQDYYEDWVFSINLWEGLAALTFLFILLRMKPRRSGGATVLLLLLYAACQVVFESMRFGDVLKWGFIRVDQLLSGVLVLLLLVFCWRKLPSESRTLREVLFRGGMIVAACLIVMAMEFTLEAKISFLEWMRADLCYLVDIGCCAWMIASVIPIWNRSFAIKGALQ
ncbi:MAG: prolipoprotein diacylglyceryl transferase [Clostridia bacterium]|nr:prolipoprotein diacylglyceryl transferase [Clostridia bacterium]MBR7175627.1 prolipoprotein diacylglyceryl transferase [Clostridia bacterium]